MLRIFGFASGLVLLHAANAHLLEAAAALKQQPLEPLIKFRAFAYIY